MNKNWWNLILSIFCLCLIVWTIYSYLCIGVTHQYNMHYVKMEGVVLNDLLNNLWLSMMWFSAMNCSVLAICTILFIIAKSLFKLRLALYLVGIVCGFVMLYHSNQLCSRLLDLSIDNSYAINDILKPQYNICIIVNILIISLSLAFDSLCYLKHNTNRKHCSCPET